MNKQVKIVITAVVALLVAGGVYYWNGREATEPIDRSSLREISTTSFYEVPNGSHNAQFSLFVDEEGRIQDIAATDVDDASGESQPNFDKFAAELRTEIQGKSLSELNAVDKIGSSSLTTNAFNAVLDDLQAQL